MIWDSYICGGFVSFLLAAISAMILVFIETFALQGFLSNMKNPWVGLILPEIAFCFILCLSILTHDLPTALALIRRENIFTVIYLLIYLFFSQKKEKIVFIFKNEN